MKKSGKKEGNLPYNQEDRIDNEVVKEKRRRVEEQRFHLDARTSPCQHQRGE